MIGCYRLAEEEQKCVCSSVYFCSFLLYNTFIKVKEENVPDQGGFSGLYNTK